MIIFDKFSEIGQNTSPKVKNSASYQREKIRKDRKVRKVRIKRIVCIIRIDPIILTIPKFK